MGKFCFAQNEDGKISVVFHSKDESQEAINFKKALVTGFQANFEGEAVVVETDQDTEHFSHYRSVGRYFSYVQSVDRGQCPLLIICNSILSQSICTSYFIV